MSAEIFLVVWSGGREAPQYETANSDVAAWALAETWAEDMDEDEGDWIDVLRINTGSGTVERLGSK